MYSENGHIQIFTTMGIKWNENRAKHLILSVLYSFRFANVYVNKRERTKNIKNFRKNSIGF